MRERDKGGATENNLIMSWHKRKGRERQRRARKKKKFVVIIISGMASRGKRKKKANRKFACVWISDTALKSIKPIVSDPFAVENFKDFFRSNDVRLFQCKR